MTTLNFDANTVEPQDVFEPIPAGRYVAVITASEMKQTKSGTGSYLELEFEIIEGSSKGRKLWSRLNLDNPSEIAVRIAQAELSAICRSTKVMQPQDSCELHNIPLIVKVACKRREDNDELTNEIKGYLPRESAKPESTPQAASSVPPWQRK